MADLYLNTRIQNAPLPSSSKNVDSPTGARPAASAGSDKAQRLAKACSDFEAIFVEQLFKTMRASVPESGLLDGGRAEEIYTSMLDQQIAREMALGQGNLGLAHQMRSKLEPQEMAIAISAMEMRDR